MLFRNRAFDLFDEMFRDPFFSGAFESGTTQLMKTDVQEQDNGYLVDIELPGYTKEDIQAELKDGYQIAIVDRKSTRLNSSHN